MKRREPSEVVVWRDRVLTVVWERERQTFRFTLFGVAPDYLLPRHECERLAATLYAAARLT